MNFYLWTYPALGQEVSIIYQLAVTVSYILLGAFIKYIDIVYDDGIFNRPLAVLLNVCCIFPNGRSDAPG
jgi:hypothetical protein